MKKQIQVTLISNKGYKPISCLIEVDYENLPSKEEMKNQGIVKICHRKYWTSRELTTYGYTKVKMRVYNKEKIEQENKEKYEQIKKERGWTKEES
jgi:hypothetical protein